MNSTVTLIVALVPALLGLLAGVIGAYHGVVASVQAVQNAKTIDANAATNATNHTTNATLIASLGDKLHSIALALPSALQQITPQIKAVESLPQLAAFTSEFTKVDEVLDAIEKVSNQVAKLKTASDAKAGLTVQT